MGTDVPMGDHKVLHHNYFLFTHMFFLFLPIFNANGCRQRYYMSLYRQPITLFFHLKSGKNTLTCQEIFDEKHREEQDIFVEIDKDLLRSRTNSSPQFRPHLKADARRINSLVPEKIERPRVHSSQWLTRTQELLRRLRLKEEQSQAPHVKRHHKHRLIRNSSRLTSHHSSSDEDWYADLPILDSSEANESITANLPDSRQGTTAPPTAMSCSPATSCSSSCSSRQDIKQTDMKDVANNVVVPPETCTTETVQAILPETQCDATETQSRLHDKQNRKHRNKSCCSKCIVT